MFLVRMDMLATTAGGMIKALPTVDRGGCVNERSEYIIRHELYIAQRGRSGGDILRWIEQDKIYHPASAERWV